MAAAGGEGRRFYNAALRTPIYHRCFLPVLQPPTIAPASVINHNQYTASKTVGFGWHHLVYTPPQPPLLQGLAAPFAAQAISVVPTAPVPPPADDENTRPAKKRKIFQRAVPVEGHLRNYAIRMFPDKDQAVELKRCFAMARKAYNFACSAVRDGRAPLNTIQLRKLWLTEPLPDWASQSHQKVSTQFLNRAIQDFVNSERTNMAKKRKNPQHRWQTKFRSLRRTPTEILHVEKDYNGKKSSTLLRFEKVTSVQASRDECLAFFGNNLKHTGGIRLVDKPSVIAMLVSDGKLMKEEAKILWDKRLGTFHLIYTYVLPRLPDPDPAFQNKSVVACDPGVYPFQAWYSPTSGKHGEMLVGGTEELMRRCNAIDRGCGRVDRFNGGERSKRKRRKRRRQLRKGLARKRQQLRGWVKSCHYNVANNLLREHHVVLQPELPTSRLTLTSTRNISSRTARAMLTWSHSLFVARLRSAVARYAGRHVLEAFEPGTSKTCTHCGAWKAALRVQDKVYDCSRCGLRVDRQLAGARNNFLAAYGAAIGVGWDGND